MTNDLHDTALTLVSGGKGILAADETVGTLTKRFERRNIESTPDTRRDYREMFFTTPHIADYVSGVILQDETIRQSSRQGIPLAHGLARQGIIPGIKVDSGAKPLARAPEETVTEGLDGLRARLQEYRELGARFAKWRAVIRVGSEMPSRRCVSANAHALARYAALCQEQGLVPIVEPEVLMTGSHTIERCEQVTGDVLQRVFIELRQQGVLLESMILKPNMVISGNHADRQASPAEVAAATIRCLSRHVPAAVPGIVFLSGGQDHLTATNHLNLINQSNGRKPWWLTFSYGRALQDEALQAWGGDPQRIGDGQRVFYHRAQCTSAAAQGSYTAAMEQELAA
jgi:fructose-bisphosphate aldolase, class I